MATLFHVTRMSAMGRKRTLRVEITNVLPLNHLTAPKRHSGVNERLFTYFTRSRSFILAHSRSVYWCMSRYCVDDGSAGEAEALNRKIKRLSSEIERLQARVRMLDKLANRDTLVDLPNRRSFLVRLDRLIVRLERRGTPAAMLFVDVNGLKSINDSFGHRAGDQALIQVALLLVASVRKTDFVARMHGDEFGVLLDRTDEWAAWKMAMRVFETVGASQFCVDGKYLSLGVAVGVGTIKRGDDPQSVIERADKQMYRVKTAPEPAISAPASAFFKRAPIT